jgi:hypothetical protein
MLIGLAAGGGRVMGQTPGSCPQIRMECGADCCGPKFEFTVHLSGGKPKDKLTYKWSVSTGEITSGQGTSSIRVDARRFPGQATTATVEIEGLAPACERTRSHSQSFCEAPQPSSRLFKRVGDLSLKAEITLLDKFAQELLRMEKGDRAFILVYNGQRRRAERAQSYLVDIYRIEAERVEIVEGGNRRGYTLELYLVPLNALPPAPSTPAPRRSSTPDGRLRLQGRRTP